MDIVFRLEFIREYAFMHAGLVIGEMIMAFQSFFYIIGIKHSHFSCLLKAVRSQRPYIAVCPHHNAEISIKCP